MKKFNFILLIFSLISCSDIKNENLQKSLVTISIKPDFSSAINFIKDTTFIPLEFCEDCIIGNISKVLKVPDGFIISDKTITKQI